MPSFDGVNLIITLDSAVATVDAQVDLYSDWKEWLKTGDNSKYPIAFDTTGGDPISATQNVGRYFFLRNDNGWRIRGPEEDLEIEIVGGLYPRDATLPLTIPTIGNFRSFIRINTSALALEVSNTQIDELHKIAGLDAANPMSVSSTSRTAGGVSQSIGTAGGTVTVTRT